MIGDKTEQARIESVARGVQAGFLDLRDRETALRQRAERCGCRLRRRGDHYELLRVEAAGSLESINVVLAMTEDSHQAYAARRKPKGGRDEQNN
jgi:hypothetical protein